MVAWASISGFSAPSRQVARESVDLHRFGQLVAQARGCRDDETAQALFEQALGLWRGDAFASLDTAWLNSVRETLHQQRFAVEMDCIDVMLRRGQHAVLLAELSDRARTHPLDERVSEHFLLALYRCGRAADALAQYQTTRRLLAEELGVDQGRTCNACTRRS
jgi:DNA-binding SARP family transcriptional activator